MMLTLGWVAVVAGGWLVYFAVALWIAGVFQAYREDTLARNDRREPWDC